MTDRQVIGSGERDQMIGRLIERTDALMTQHDDFKTMLGRLTTTLDTFGRTVSKLESALDHIAERAPDGEKMIARIVQLESEVATWTIVRKRAISAAVIIALLSLTWGTIAGGLLKQAIGLP